MQYNNYIFESLNDSDYTNFVLFNVKAPNGDSKIMSVDTAKSTLLEIIEKNLAKSVKFCERDTLEAFKGRNKKEFGYQIPDEVIRVLTDKFQRISRLKIFDVSGANFQNHGRDLAKCKFILKNVDGGVYLVTVCPFKNDNFEYYYDISSIDRIK